MFAGFRKYQKWIWVVAIIVIIPSFVIFFSPDARLSRSGGAAAGLGTINGKPISVEQYLNAKKEAYLSFFFRHGEWPERSAAAKQYGFDEERETYGRLLLIEKLKDLNVNISTESAAALAREFLFRVARTNVAPNQIFDAFYLKILRPNGLSKFDFERYIRHEAGVFHLVTLAGLPGKLVTPQEAEEIYRRENQEVLVDAVFFSASNYISSVSDPDPQMLSQFYSNNMASYRLPERVQVAYVKFVATNYLAEADKELEKVTNLTQRLREIYLQRGTNYFKNSNGNVLSEEEAIEKLKQEFRESVANDVAMKKAYEFAGKLPESGANLQTFLNVAASNNLVVSYTEPFDEEGPSNLKVSEKFIQVAFSLTKEDPIALTPIESEDGAYLIALKEKLPSTIPPLEVIREKVIADYKRKQAIDIAQTRGKIFYNSLTNALASKRTFTEACLESKYTPISLPPISRSTKELEKVQIPVSLMEIKRVAFELEQGQVSQFIPTRDGGMIVYLRSVLPIDEQKLQRELPQFLAGIRQTRLYEAADLWLQKQRQAMQMVIPEKKGRESKG
ncbi:MAG TPA: peptidylprolyl isomerase [Verrucomicrobiota bacterium]|nr:peptidylprolyl isomerase [Verrucomicrobiota bacterium]